MKIINYTELTQEKLAKTMESVIQNHEQIVITHNEYESVVMLSLEDYEGLQETCYLLRSPKNTKRLMRSIREVENNLLITKDLLEN